MFPPDTRVLVVDDMAAMRIRVTNQLRVIGLKLVEHAGNGQDAFDLVMAREAEGKPFDLIISDWNMPVLTGIDFLQKVREIENFKKLPFLMVTAEGEKDKVIRAIKTGVSDFLIKPVNSEDLHLKLINVWKKYSNQAEIKKNAI